MVLEEYQRIIVTRLQSAYNNKDMSALVNTFEDADRKLKEDNVSHVDRDTFWKNIEKVVYTGLIIERQSNSALLVLMQTLQREIAARAEKK
jgi:hypothetical protein